MFYVKLLVFAFIQVFAVRSAHLDFHHSSHTWTPDARIVGGNDTGRVKFMGHVDIVDIQNFGIVNCGAVLVTPRHVLTSGHCVSVQPGQQVSYVSFGGRIIESSAVDIRIHRRYRRNSNAYNIAIIKLASDVTVKYKNIIAPIQMESKSALNVSIAGKTAVAYGYGESRDTASAVNMTVMAQDDCQKEGRAVADGQFCTSGRWCKGVCKGDTGGPLVIDNVLVGIISHASDLENCLSSQPSVFTRVAQYRDWIDEQLEILK